MSCWPFRQSTAQVRAAGISSRSVGVAELSGVAHRGFDADAEQVAKASGVAAGGVYLGEDAVGSKRQREMPALC